MSDAEILAAAAEVARTHDEWLATIEVRKEASEGVDAAANSVRWAEERYVTARDKLNTIITGAGEPV